MTLPAPTPGLVIHYSYLWQSEYAEGKEEGRKDRPCAVVASVRTDDVGDLRVLVLPITHRLTANVEEVVEIPAKVKAHLGLDETPSWIVLSEWNEFVWPGPDLRQRRGQASFSYGILPPGLFKVIRTSFADLVRRGKAARIHRTD